MAMTLTTQQRQTTARVDLGGDALEAIQALAPAAPTIEPRATVVTVTTGQLTLDQLIAATRGAGNAILATTRKVTLMPHASGVYFSTGGEAASAGSTPVPSPGASIDGTAASLAGLRFYAASVKMSIVEEG